MNVVQFGVTVVVIAIIPVKMSDEVFSSKGEGILDRLPLLVRLPVEVNTEAGKVPISKMVGSGNLRKKRKRIIYEREREKMLQYRKSITTSKAYFGDTGVLLLLELPKFCCVKPIPLADIALLMRN